MILIENRLVVLLGELLASQLLRAAKRHIARIDEIDQRQVAAGPVADAENIDIFALPIVSAHIVAGGQTRVRWDERLGSVQPVQAGPAFPTVDRCVRLTRDKRKRVE